MREEHLPHIWCPGCGHGILMRDVAQAVKNLGIDQEKVCLVSGIGCASRAAGYMDFQTMHTTHGRAIAFATGVMLSIMYRAISIARSSIYPFKKILCNTFFTLYAESRLLMF